MKFSQGRHTEREHWDRLARQIPDLFHAPSTQYYRSREIELVSRNFGTLHGKRVLKLDLWNEAVNTRIIEWIQAQGAQVFGLDISGITTVRARANLGGTVGAMRFVQADIRDLPFADESFDFVYTMGTIEHVAEYRTAIQEIHRVLKTGGKTIIGVPHKWNIFLRPLLVSVLDWFDRYPYSPEKSFGLSELRRDVEAAGLRVERRTGILALPGIFRMADCYCLRRNLPFRRLSSALLAPFDYMESRWQWLDRFGYLLAVVATKHAAQAHRG